MNLPTQRGLREQLAHLHARYPLQCRTIDGHEWCWLETRAPGPRVLLVPGAIGDGSMFLKTIQSLGERLDMVAISYPDLSDPEELADGLAKLCNEEGWDSLIVVGSSYGAYWSQFFARRHPQLVKTLVLGNTFVAAGDVFDDPAAEEARLLASTGEQVHAQWLTRVRSAPASELRDLQEIMLAERQPLNSLRTRMLGVARARPAERWNAASIQVVTIETDNDPLIPARAREALRNAYPSARHVRMPTGAHYPQVLNSQEYERVLLEAAGSAELMEDFK